MERKLGATAAAIIKKKICKAMYWYFLWYICLYGSQDRSICTNSPAFTTKITTAAVRIAFFSCSTKKIIFIQPCYFYRVLHKVWMPTKIKQIAFLCIFIIRLHNGIMNVSSFFSNRHPSAATWSMTKKLKTNISWGSENVKLSFMKLNHSFSLVCHSLAENCKTLELQK